MRPAFTRTIAVVSLPLWLAMLALPAAAQQDTGAPFAAQHADLLRAADFHLDQAGKRLASPPDQPKSETAVSTSSPSPALFASISAARLATARKKLLALGVDAARLFAEEGVPEQLLVIAEVESAFDPRALSSKGARGLWQFMPETARRYGLRVDKYIDERLHVVRSTRAAARYIRDLHLLFGDWQLALAAYNAGEQRVIAAIERSAGRSFAGLAHVLPEETRLFVPAVLGEMGGSRGQ